MSKSKSKSKYDIPYAMAPVKNNKKKKSRYSNYIDEQESFFNRVLSSPGKKISAYFIFFVIFGTVFITALRSNRHPEASEYELDLEYSNSRENNLIDDAIIDKQSINDIDNNNVDDIDEIDILDSDDGEVAKLTGSTKQKNPNDKKKQFKSTNDEFDQELDELIASANEQLEKSKSKKKVNNIIDQIDQIDDVAAKEAVGRHKNIVKGEHL
jgi:flagellar hook-basal body complex protein FliE